ncbi:MAG: hypothetical protein KDA89_07185 [Planctomycetaceae bacterium]|nr:hypothetical protein [Planctomycetaceae bacterium]
MKMRLVWCVISALTAAAPAIPDDTPEDWKLRDVSQIRIQENRTFSAEDILRELSGDAVMLRQVDVHVSMEVFAETAAERIAEGYRHQGFPNAVVTGVCDAESHQVTISVNEGRRIRCGSIAIDGAAPTEATVIQSAVRAERKREDHGGVRWDSSLWAACSETSANHFADVVRETMSDLGFPFAEVTAVVTGEETAAELNIAIRRGAPLAIDEVQYSGLERHSIEDLNRLLNLHLPATVNRELREGIRRRLLETARFSWVHVWTDTPFGPGDSVTLHVDVREFPDVPKLSEPFTPLQQQGIALARWMSHWPEQSEDLGLTIEVNLPQFLSTMKTADVQKQSLESPNAERAVADAAVVDPDTGKDAHAGTDTDTDASDDVGDAVADASVGDRSESEPQPKARDSAMDLKTLLGAAASSLFQAVTNRAETLTVNLRISPSRGAVLDFRTRDRSGVLLRHYSLLQTPELLGVVAHHNRQSLLIANPELKVIQQMSLEGHPPGERRFGMKLGFGVKSTTRRSASGADKRSESDSPSAIPPTAVAAETNDDNRQGMTEWLASPAAAIDILQKMVAQGPDPSFQPADRIDVTIPITAGHIKLHQGCLQEVVGNVPGFRLQIISQADLVHSMVSDIQAATQQTTNVWKSGHPLESLVEFLTVEGRDIGLLSSEEVALLEHFRTHSIRALDAAVVSLQTDAEQRQNRFQIPGCPSSTPTDAYAGGHTALWIARRLMPVGSTAHRLFAAIALSADGQDESLAQLANEIIASEHHGPLDCLLTALALENNKPQWKDLRKSCAEAGLRRCSADAFLSDLGDIAHRPGPVSSITNRLINAVRRLSDEECRLLSDGLPGVLTLTAAQCKTIATREILLRLSATTGTIIRAIRNYEYDDPDAVIHATVMQLWSEVPEPILRRHLALQLIRSQPTSRATFHNASRSKTDDAANPGDSAGKSLLDRISRPHDFDLPTAKPLYSPTPVP